MFLAPSSLYLIRELCAEKSKELASKNSTPLLSIDFIRGYISVIEDTLSFHLWLKNDNGLKSDFTVKDNMIDSKAINRAKYYIKISWIKFITEEIISI